jgi:hypothetical protein
MKNSISLISCNSHYTVSHNLNCVHQIMTQELTSHLRIALRSQQNAKYIYTLYYRRDVMCVQVADSSQRKGSVYILSP